MLYRFVGAQELAGLFISAFRGLLSAMLAHTQHTVTAQHAGIDAIPPPAPDGAVDKCLDGFCAVPPKAAQGVFPKSPGGGTVSLSEGRSGRSARDHLCSAAGQPGGEPDYECVSQTGVFGFRLLSRYIAHGSGHSSCATWTSPDRVSTTTSSAWQCTTTSPLRFLRLRNGPHSMHVPRSCSSST